MRTIFLCFLLTISLARCKDPLDKNFETITGKYKIGFLNSAKPSENILVFCSDCKEMMAGLINKKIKRSGFDDNFLIIERVGNYGDLDAKTLDSLVVRYYILDLKKQMNDDKKYLFGPMDLDAFQAKKKELGIEDLKFTKEYNVN
jgi:hypothetical protein